MAYRWGIKNCCSPYEAFPVSLTCGLCMGILNSGVVIPGNAYWLSTVTFDTPQTFYKPDGTTYSPHCWEIIYDSATVMSTVEVTDWTMQAPGSWMHPEDDCAALVADRLFKITNYPAVYGTTPCCPQGTPPPPMNGVRSCCKSAEQYTVDPAGSMPLAYQVGEAFFGSFSVWSNNVQVHVEFGCWEAIDNAVGPMMGNAALGPPEPDCQSIVFPLSPPSHTGPCCPPPDECDSQRLVPLQNTIDTFKVSRESVLNPGDQPPPEDWKETAAEGSMDWTWEGKSTKKKKGVPGLSPEEGDGGGREEGKSDII